MNTFLDKTAQHLIDNYPDNLSNLCVVLPNKRAGLFLKQHLSQKIEQPIWLPEIIGTEALIEQLSEMKVVDNVIQLFELYEVYQKTTKNPEPFEEFSNWGQILLHDFNEIDRYLVPTSSFFKHINEARAIEVWNVGDKEITDFQSQYLKFWKQLGTLYTRLGNHLKAKKMAYQGMAYRTVAEELEANPTQFIAQKIKWDKVIFVGFNALNKAEEVLIAELKKAQKCEILFDADNYYLEDKMQESGAFLRKMKQKDIFEPFNWITNKFKTQQKEISIFGISQNIGQAKFLSSILNTIDDTKNYTDTAVVLADENLLIPVLQSIPKKIEHINVTMGYPLKNTPINNFFETYFLTLVNAERYGKKEALTYHHKDLLKLFQLPFSFVLFGKENCNTIQQHLIKNNWIFINKEKLQWINDLIESPFPTSYTVKNTLLQTLRFIETGKHHFIAIKNENEKSSLELEYLFQFAKLFNQMIDLTSKHPYIESSKGFYMLYQQILNSFSIDLYGEPLKGLQVLGMLETRNIDFKNIILLSANEGILPAGKTFNSFIPYDIKKDDAYNLPTHKEKDAIYAYHFYRLIQNAENINIVYNTETSEFGGSGEQSRFVTQIEHELSQYNNIKINKQLVTYKPLNKKTSVHEIEKTTAIIEKLTALFSHGISPTAITTYINCPLNFYYQYVLNVREQDGIVEVIDPSLFGTFLHNSLEVLYQPYVKKNITTIDLKKMLPLINEVVKNVFLEVYNAKELSYGKNLLTLNIVQKYITTFIKNEIEWVKTLKKSLYIVSVEEKLSATIEVNNIAVKLRGKADRIDGIGNEVRIIDYKTGTVGNAEVKTTGIIDLESPKKNKAFQLMMYALMYGKNHDTTTTSITSGIISFKKLSNGYMPFSVGKNNLVDDDVLMQFEDLLIHIIQEILDPNIPFKHKTDSEYCNFC